MIASGTGFKPPRLDLPPKPPIERIEWEEFTESVGDPALRVLVVLARGIRDDEWEWDHLKPVQDAIFAAVRGSGDSRFPYVRFVLSSELEVEAALR
jgi:hypothetical protein